MRLIKDTLSAWACDLQVRPWLAPFHAMDHNYRVPKEYLGVNTNAISFLFHEILHYDL